jgi:hypothetical protein
VNDVVPGGALQRAIGIEQKTGRPVPFATTNITATPSRRG